MTVVESAATAPRPTPSPRRRGRSVEGKPRVAVAFTVLFFVVLYLPIVVVVAVQLQQQEVAVELRRVQHPVVRAVLRTTPRCSRSLRASPVHRVRRDDRVGRARHDARARASSGCAPGKARAVGVVALAPAGHARDRHRCRGAAVLHRPRRQAVADHRDHRGDHVLDRLRHRHRARPAGSMSRGGRGGRSRPGLHAVAVAAPGHPADDPRPALVGVGAAGVRPRLRRLRARVLHHRRRPAAAAGADLLRDPARRSRRPSTRSARSCWPCRCC